MPTVVSLNAGEDTGYEYHGSNSMNKISLPLAAAYEYNISERNGTIMAKIHCPVGTKGNQK